MANTWTYDDETDDEMCSCLSFDAMRSVTFQGRRYRRGDEVIIDLPRPISRACLDDLSGQGGPWGFGGYTSAALAELQQGRF